MPSFKSCVAEIGCVHVQARNKNHADKLIYEKFVQQTSGITFERGPIVQVIGIPVKKVRI